MKLKLFITHIFLFYCFAQAQAQFNESIRTGRPGNAIGAFTVGQGIFQLQSGFDYFKTSIQGEVTTQGFLNNTVMRYGLTEPFEISALIEYKTVEVTETDGEKTQYQGVSAFDVGMRYHIFTGRNLIPNVGFQMRLRLPVDNGLYEIKDVAPRFIVVTSQKLSKTFTLITNWGAAWNGINSSPTGTYVINLAFPFNATFGAYVETFGSFQQGIFTSNIDTGLAWLVTNDLQFDVYSGYGKNQGVSAYFLSLGVSWRTKHK